jgi:hypothetical protein
LGDVVPLDTSETLSNSTPTTNSTSPTVSPLSTGAEADYGDNGLSIGVKVGIGIGTTVGALVLFGLGFYVAKGTEKDKRIDVRNHLTKTVSDRYGAELDISIAEIGSSPLVEMRSDRPKAELPVRRLYEAP